MNWRKSATGKWVAFRGNTSFVIDSLACYEGNKPCRRYRLRVNGVSVGGVRPELFKSVISAKKYAESVGG